MDGALARLLSIDTLLKTAPDAHSALADVLALAGEAIGAHRATVFAVHDMPAVGLGQSLVAEWRAAGIERPIARSAMVSEPLGPQDETLWDWSVRRRRGEGIAVLTRTLEGRVREVFEAHGIVSTYSEPIFVRGDWWGHCGVSDCERERPWTADERALLKLVARLIGRALGREAEAEGLGEAMRAAMVNSAPEGIIVIDEDGFACEFNPAAEAMFGLARSEVIGRSITSVVTPRSLRGRHNAGFRRYIETGEAHILGRRVNTEGQRADGTSFPIELTVTEVKAQGRRLFAAYVRDLTALRAAEETLERQRDALYQSEKLNALGSLLAGVAHELNNPLSVVVGRAIMLEEQVDDPRIVGSLRRLREAADRCARISKSFLAIARKTPTRHVAIDIAEPLGAALELNGYALRSTGVEVDFAPPQGLAAVLADADLLVQVFSNIIVNAEQALRQAPEPRRLRVSARTEGTSAVRVEIADNGPGIPAAVASRVFEPFYTTKGVGAGTGIGLSVSRGMVEAMGGTIAVDPGPGRGARFIVTLPVAPQTAAGAADQQAAPSGGALRVLIVDDEEELRNLLSELLVADGCVVDTAEDGASALRLIAGGADYDAVLADARMPKLDGATLYREALAIAPRLAGRFAIITGDTFLGGMHGGTDGPEVIEKPFEPKRIRAFLSGVRAEADADGDGQP